MRSGYCSTPAAASTEAAATAKPADSSTTAADQKRKRKREEQLPQQPRQKNCSLKRRLNSISSKRELASTPIRSFSNPDYAHDAKQSKTRRLKQSIGDKQTSVKN